MSAILCLDFDGLVHAGDLTAGLLARFATTPEPPVQPASPEARLAAAMATIEDEPATIHGWVQEHLAPNPDLPALTDWTHWNDWHTAVVTTAPDICVNPALAALEQSRVARHTGRATHRYRWTVRHRSPRGFDVRERFVASYLGALRESTGLVVYATNRAENREAAHLAQVVFAGPDLYELLGMEHPCVRPFTTVTDILATLGKEGEAWHASCSSTTAAAGW